MSYLAAAWAWFSALGWVAKAGTVLTALSPGLAFLGPIGTLVGMVWTAVTTVVSWVFQGLQVVITNPVVLSVVVLFYVGGRWQQHHVDLAKIEAAHIEAQNVAKKVEGAYAVERARADEAIKARDAAKALPLLEPNVVVTTDHPVKAVAPPLALDPKPTAAELRQAKRARVGAKCDAVFCF